MTDAPTDALFREVLAAHLKSGVVCTCMGWTADWADGHESYHVQHQAHVARELSAALGAERDSQIEDETGQRFAVYRRLRGLEEGEKQ